MFDQKAEEEVSAGVSGSTNSSYMNTDDVELSEKLSKIWLESKGLTQEGKIKLHNEVVAESKRKARNLYDPAEANYHKVVYSSTPQHTLYVSNFFCLCWQLCLCSISSFNDKR